MELDAGLTQTELLTIRISRLVADGWNSAFPYPQIPVATVVKRDHPSCHNRPSRSSFSPDIVFIARFRRALTLRIGPAPFPVQVWLVLVPSAR